MPRPRPGLLALKDCVSMQGRGGSRGLFVHLLAGAALGAVVVLMVWIFSGGRPFGEVVGTSEDRKSVV